MERKAEREPFSYILPLHEYLSTYKMEQALAKTILPAESNAMKDKI